MISIIIPLFNKAHTIVNTLNKAINQTYSNFEVIIVNDGSTDNSVETINTHFNDSRIRIINQKNAGVSAARNKGIKEAAGEYIAFLDADDEWFPSYLEKVVKAINKYPKAGIYITGRYSQNFINKKRSSNIPSKYADKITKIDFFDNPHVFMHISATTIKSSLLKNNVDTWGNFIVGQKSSEDFTFLFRVALHTSTIYIGEPLSIYNGGIENQTTSVLKKQQIIDDCILFHNKVIEEYYNTNCIDHKLKIFMRYEFRHIILQYLNLKDYQSLNHIFKNINKVNLQLLITPFEKKIYQKKQCNFLSKMYIKYTKVIWRTHKFPRVK